MTPAARAQIMVLFAIGAMGILALIGLVVDGANLYLQRRTVQTAADAAALAGARALSNASAANQLNSVSSAVTAYAAANAFGIAPSVTCAAFVDTSGALLAAGGISSDGSSPSCPTSATTIPSAASGVYVEARVNFPTYIMGMFNFPNATAAAHAIAQVGVLTAADTRFAPLIACGGGDGSAFAALRFTTQTPVVVTSTPGVLAATPTVLPVIHNPQVTTDQLLVTPVGVATPAYVVNAARDGTIYYIKGQNISTSNGSNCGANGFHGASAASQPTPYMQDVAGSSQAVIAGQTGNAVPAISQRVATSGACVAGTDPANTWQQGSPGCVMILPLVNGSDGLDFTIQAWAAFYVWCTNSTGSGCQEFSGQLLANWPAAGGPAVNTWTFAAKGSIAVLHLTQ